MRYKKTQLPLNFRLYVQEFALRSKRPMMATEALRCIFQKLHCIVYIWKGLAIRKDATNVFQDNSYNTEHCSFQYAHVTTITETILQPKKLKCSKSHSDFKSVILI